MGLVTYLEANIGISRIATNKEDISEKDTVQACSLNNSPAAPWIYTIGKNTTIVVSVDEVMAPATSEVPLMAASFEDNPFSKFR